MVNAIRDGLLNVMCAAPPVRVSTSSDVLSVSSAGTIVSQVPIRSTAKLVTRCTSGRSRLPTFVFIRPVVFTAARHIPVSPLLKCGSVTQGSPRNALVIAVEATAAAAATAVAVLSATVAWVMDDTAVAGCVMTETRIISVHSLGRIGRV